MDASPRCGDALADSSSGGFEGIAQVGSYGGVSMGERMLPLCCEVVNLYRPCHPITRVDASGHSVAVKRHRGFIMALECRASGSFARLAPAVSSGLVDRCDDLGGYLAKVLQALGSPPLKPALNHVCRSADEPWVNCDSSTVPPIFFCIASSP